MSDLQTRSFSNELRRYIALAWHWGWFLILVPALAAGTAYWQSHNEIPTYEASTRLLIVEALQNNQIADYSSLMVSERLAQTYTEMITVRPILEKTAERLGGGLSAGYLKEALRVEPVQNANLINMWLVDTDPARAAQALNTLVEVFAEENTKLQTERFAASKVSLQAQMSLIDQQIKDTDAQLNALGISPADKSERTQLETNLTQYRQTYSYLLQSYEGVRVTEVQSTSNIVQIEPAISPERPLPSKVFQNTALAGMVGLLLAGGIVFLIEMLDDTVKGPLDITGHVNIPILGVINHFRMDEKPITESKPRSQITEAFRVLKTNIQYASVDRPIHSLLVVSPSPGEGKTTIATNLGIVLAQGEHRVVIVDGDLRNPAIHKQFGLPNRPGLSSLFVQRDEKLDGALRRTSLENLAVLTSGALPPNPAELLGSEKMLSVLTAIREKADIIVIDTAPVMAVADAVVLASKADGVLIVVVPGKTRLVALQQCIDRLKRVNANVLGVVINNVKHRLSRYGYDYYYQGYYPDYYSDDEGKPSSHATPLKRQSKNVKQVG